jgi:hypothetical protein
LEEISAKKQLFSRFLEPSFHSIGSIQIPTLPHPILKMQTISSPNLLMMRQYGTIPFGR